MPSKLRERLNLIDGDRFVATIENDGSIKLRSLKQQVLKCLDMLKDLAPIETEMTQEILDDRRKEAQKEKMSFNTIITLNFIY